VSQFGSEITMLALPLVAVLLLDASPLEVGLLRAAWSGPRLVFSFAAGLAVDRMRRKPLLIGSDLVRAVALSAIPLAALLGGLEMWLVFLIAFVLGTFDTLFIIAYQSFLPSVISRADLVEGNGKLQTTAAVAQVAGPGFGGALVQLLTGPVVLLVDSLTFLFSAVMIAVVRVREETPPKSPQPQAIRTELSVGWRHMVAHPLLRAIGGSSAILGVFFGVQQAVLIVYLANELRLSPFVIGVVLAVGSVGAVVGAIVAGMVGARNLGPTLVLAVIVNGVGASLLGFAGGAAAIPLLVLGQVLAGVSIPIYTVNVTSLRQAVAPPELLGRITAAFAVISWGMIPVGALLGGLLPSLIGVQATLAVGGLGKFGAAVWLLRSPIRRMREIPAPA
jgi:MFS family permease